MCRKRIFKLLFISLLFASCTKDDDGSPAPKTNYNKYSGSASYGDLVTFSISESAGTYVIVNETTGESDGGAFEVISDGDIQGVYMLSEGSENYFAIELDDQLIASNFPSGNQNNEISFGVTSEISNVGKEDQIAGDYVYIVMGDVPVNGSSDIKEWGLFNLSEDGDMGLVQFASAYGDGSDFTDYSIEQLDSFGIPAVDTSFGTWSLSGESSEMVDINIGGIDLTGFTLVNNDANVFLIDLGTGNGFALGFKIVDITAEEFIGDYIFVETSGDGGSVLFANIDDLGNLSAYSTTDGENFDGGLIGELQASSFVTNLAYYNEAGLGSLCIVKSGDGAMFFYFNDDGTLNSYGAGRKM